MTSTKSGAAWLSVVSNCVLIVLKLAAGLLTGSIAILTEAIHSAIDLVASLIALFSVRKAEEPADEDHPYGHEKAENVAAGAEAMLILLGAVIIVIEAVRRLLNGSEVTDVGIGIAVIGLSIVANLLVSGYLYRRARGARVAGARGRCRPPPRRCPDLDRRPRRPRARQGDRERRLRLDRRPAGRRSDRRHRHPARPALGPGADGRGAAGRGARPDRAR